MAAKVGHKCTVKLGSVQTLGIGTWTITGVDVDQLEDTEFGDDYKTYKVGLNEQGSITFNGYYDPADSTGQDALRTYWENGTSVTSLRLYYDATFYWTPSTISPVSAVYITSWDVSADKSGLSSCSFTAKVIGRLALVDRTSSSASSSSSRSSSVSSSSSSSA